MAREHDTRRAPILSAALLAGMTAEGMLDGDFVIPQAQAVIGRPLTPLSYAGLARRMICATSTYVGASPAGCRTVIVERATLHRCGATYYRPAGGRYVVVRVE